MGLIIIPIFIAYIVLSVVIVIGAFRSGRHDRCKWCKGVIAGLLMFLIPTWDIPIGRLNFHNSCEKESGIFIYHTVSVPDEYFLKPGERDLNYHENTKFAYARGGELNYSKIRENYTIRHKSKNNYSRWGHINMNEMVVSEKSGSVLGKLVTLHYTGGWLLAPLSTGGGPGSSFCSGDSINEGQSDKTLELMYRIFRRI